MKSYIFAAGKAMLRTMRMASLSGKQSKGQQKYLASQISEAPTDPIMSDATALQQASGLA